MNQFTHRLPNCLKAIAEIKKYTRISLHLYVVLFISGLSLTTYAQTLPITIYVTAPGWPIDTFELKTDNFLYKVKGTTHTQLGNDQYTNITFTTEEYPAVRCTKMDASLTAYDLRSSQFRNPLMTKVCNGITYILKPNRDIFNSTSNVQIGDGASLIRNENNHLIKIAFNGSLYLYS